MNAKQLKASIRPRKRFNINLGTGVIARMNVCNELFIAALLLGTLTLDICLDLDCFQYCYITFQELINYFFVRQKLNPNWHEAGHFHP